MQILIALLALVALGMLAEWFGNDSRDGRDWDAASEVWRTRVDR